MRLGNELSCKRSVANFYWNEHAIYTVQHCRCYNTMNRTMVSRRMFFWCFPFSPRQTIDINFGCVGEEYFLVRIVSMLHICDSTISHSVTRTINLFVYVRCVSPADVRLVMLVLLLFSLSRISIVLHTRRYTAIQTIAISYHFWSFHSILPLHLFISSCSRTQSFRHRIDVTIWLLHFSIRWPMPSHFDDKYTMSSHPCSLLNKL